MHSTGVQPLTPDIPKHANGTENDWSYAAEDNSLPVRLGGEHILDGTRVKVGSNVRPIGDAIYEAIVSIRRVIIFV